ncbi:DUF1778 domain-containing protein [Lyngbya sp. CCY1209]|uniref:type II toxin-antitoxin system TacA family antitoxin n=1 Tax=Lyngbya sp. CCY1209 TaxID=2886103 RepID=UPI002D207307|nr:DUF1778 domain-containing protein [Lyngbya sp. CCY1209]MEB3883147.1 DUF1778 domain-containing protein [Lyngbya sp. CCY1209]
MTLPHQKTQSIRIQIDEEQLDLIDRAAQWQGKTRIDFILDAATAAAQEAFLDRQMFFLGDRQWEAFQAALDAEPVPNEGLQKTANFKAPWE